MRPCACREPHPLKRVVLTGGPGAGKTAVLAFTSLGRAAPSTTTQPKVTA